MRYRYLLLFDLLVVSRAALAQQATDDKKIPVQQKIEATPVKSGLSYDQLSQFFQTSVTSGSNGGFDFKSTGYGIDKLFSKSAQLDLSSYYTGHKFERNFEFALGAHKSKGGELSTIIVGFKYSPINDRSKSDHNFMKDKSILTALLKRQDLFEEARKSAMAKINAIADKTARDKAFADFQADQAKYHADRKEKNIPKAIKAELQSDANASEIFLDPTTDYNAIAKRVDMGSLLTLSFNPGYNYQHKYFDTTSFTAAFVKGFGNPNKPVNIDLKIQGILAHDTLGTAHNFSRQMINWTAGMNKVLANDDKLNPIIEFEAQAEDDYIASSQLYKNEERHKFTANAVLRIHLTSQVSLPITLKYDIKKANVFSIFQLQWNLESSKAKN